MVDRIGEYIKLLTKEFPFLERTIFDCKEWWFPEEPPTTVLFGEFGRSIANYMIENQEACVESGFNVIEAGMTDCDPLVQTAVATGLIEAMVGRSDDNLQLWNRLEKLFGMESRKHALAWRSFGN